MVSSHAHVAIINIQIKIATNNLHIDTKHAAHTRKLPLRQAAIIKGIVCDVFILTLEQIIVLNIYFTYN